MQDKYQQPWWVAPAFAVLSCAHLYLFIYLLLHDYNQYALALWLAGFAAMLLTVLWLYCTSRFYHHGAYDLLRRLVLVAVMAFVPTACILITYYQVRVREAPGNWL